MRMAYQRKGGPLIRWDQGAAPRSNIGQGRAADSLSLGALEETGGMRVIKRGQQISDGALGNYEPVPKAGGPEIIGDAETNVGNLATLAVVGGAVWWLFFKKDSHYRVTRRK